MSSNDIEAFLRGNNSVPKKVYSGKIPLNKKNYRGKPRVFN